DAYVCWRIHDRDGVDAFVRSVGTAEGAKEILTQMLSSELGAAIGALEVGDLISTDAGEDGKLRVDLRPARFRDDLVRQLAPLREKYGIEVVDVRLRRTNHPASVRQSIYERIISERNEKAARYEQEGKREAANIESASKRRIEDLKTRAEAAAIV